MTGPLEVLVCYVPVPDTEKLLTGLFSAGAGRVGDYDSCAFVTAGQGQFRPLTGANPTIGEVGTLEYVTENRVEVTFPAALRSDVLAALRASHPYEEPAFHVISNAASLKDS